MRGGVGVQSNNPRGFMLFRRMGKEPLGGSHIMPFAQEKINRSTLLIDRAIQVNPLALYLNVGLIQSVGTKFRMAYRLTMQVRRGSPHGSCSLLHGCNSLRRRGKEADASDLFGKRSRSGGSG